MTDLLPCPFCGGEAELTGFNAPEYWVWCPNCKASADAHTGKENAIAAWNTRSAETCENVDEGANYGYFKCSECGAECSVEWCYSGYGAPNFCPNCGRKVGA